MAVLVDAGALIAIDRRDRSLEILLRLAQQERVPLRTGAPLVAQVWRDGARQANLARVLGGIDVLPLDESGARRVGELLGATAGTGVVDAHVVLLAHPEDEILTSDSEDMQRLLAARGVRARVVQV